MRDPPIEEILSWPKPNYIDPPTRGPALIISEATLISLAVILLGLRFYVRIKIIRSLGWDDWIMLMAMVPTIGLVCSTQMGTKYGWGMHIWDNHIEWSEPSRISSWVSQLLFVLSVGITKLSILVSFLRLSTNRNFSRIIWFSIALITAWTVSFACTLVFRCIPLSNYWKIASEKGCVPENATVLACSGTNAFTDIVLVLLPVPTLWKLRLPLQQKLALVFLLGLGGLACIAGAIRTYYVDQTINRTYDVTWVGYMTWLWTALECIIAIICSTVPTLRPLIKLYFPRILGSNGSTPFGNSRDRSTGLYSTQRQSTAYGGQNDLERGKYGYPRKMSAAYTNGRYIGGAINGGKGVNIGNGKFGGVIPLSSIESVQSTEGGQGEDRIGNCNSYQYALHTQVRHTQQNLRFSNITSRNQYSEHSLSPVSPTAKKFDFRGSSGVGFETPGTVQDDHIEKEIGIASTTGNLQADSASTSDSEEEYTANALGISIINDSDNDFGSYGLNTIPYGMAQ